MIHVVLHFQRVQKGEIKELEFGIWLYHGFYHFFKFSDNAKAVGGRGVSVAINSDRVADIQPLHHIQTVQVEVEPDGGEEEGEEKPPPEEAAEEPQSPSPSAQLPQAEAQSPHPTGVTSVQTPVQPLSGAKNEEGVVALDRLSPPPLPTVSEGLQEAGRKAASVGKKSKKSKPLSTKDLLSLHKDVGKSNKQLLEPSTPEFKPTAEWVSIHLQQN